MPCNSEPLFGGCRHQHLPPTADQPPHIPTLYLSNSLPFHFRHHPVITHVFPLHLGNVKAVQKQMITNRRRNQNATHLYRVGPNGLLLCPAQFTRRQAYLPTISKAYPAQPTCKNGVIPEAVSTDPYGTRLMMFLGNIKQHHLRDTQPIPGIQAPRKIHDCSP